MINLILCGGKGTRLWPISRTLMPKQFIKLFSNKSLFQLTVERNSKICTSQFIISNSEQYFLAQDQLEELNKTNNRYILEPLGRNTAPAITLACLALDKNEILLVTPSDHLIKDEKKYKEVLRKAEELATKDNIVTFGITPTYPEIGYGYIEKGSKFDVKAFHEKPDIKTATSYLKKKNYYWNSGMFCFKVSIFLEEIKKHSPKIYELCLNAYKNSNKTDFIRIKHEDMLAIPENSIDYAVMEKSDKVKVIPSNIKWSDLGSFDALDEELNKDEYGNTINKNYIQIDSKNNLIYGNQRKIATIDIENTIIVDTGDALLVSKKGKSQKVKKIIKKLKEGKSELPNIHLTGYRPWGKYTILENSSGYKIKKIEVNPGKRLSLQKHFYRNEHWIVLSGSALVTIENNTFILNPNESTYIKAGQLHRLENRKNIPLIIIETQVGDYTEEDDIIRIDDDFQRQNN